MNKKRISFLFQRYLDDIATPDELKELEKVVSTSDDIEMLNEIIDDKYYTIPEQSIADKSGSPAKERSFEQIVRQPQHQKTYRLWPRIAAAAAIILVTGAGLFYYNHQRVADQQTNFVKNDIKPGGNKAYLILANGSRIVLTNAKNGQLAKQTGVTITKTANGQVVYSVENTSTTTAKPNEYNTIATPKGGKWRVNLPDGTAVWLNAASSMAYPASFTGSKVRRVELKGEAYFEVAHDKNKPFIVVTSGQSIQVLGTHFNVNSYEDEDIVKTTLLEGKVEVSPQGNLSPIILLPGEQSLVSANTIRKKRVDPELSVSWRDGSFAYKNAPLSLVMREIARWYDITIVYKITNPEAHTFSGSVSRYDQVDGILRAIELTGDVKFIINGKQITVTQ